jgi:hypothetical protein
MLLFLPSLAAGVLVGLAAGGRLSRLADVRIRAPWLLWLALGAQVLLGAGPLAGAPRPVGVAIVLGSYAAIGAWLLLNALRSATALRRALIAVALGWALNLAPIAANGGMPVSASAMEASGFDADVDVSEGRLGKHVPLEDAALAGLGDVIPVPALGAVLSAGDLVLGAGLAAAVAAAMGPGRRVAVAPALAA